jgi:DNA-binding NtrC family response regulator
MARVLLVEPDRRICKFIAGILAEFGHHVEPCNDARAARRRLGHARFDVLATDLMLAADNVDDFPALAQGLPLLTLRGHRFDPSADNDDRPAHLHQMPFRFADLAALVAAVDSGGSTLPAAAPIVGRAHPLTARGEGTGRQAAASAA